MRLLQRDNNLTTIMVTHDQDEAMAMADRLVVMRDGRIEQIGDQQALYEYPQTPFVARFIGHSNLVPGQVQDARMLAIPGANVALAGSYGMAGAATLAIRPERITLAPPGLHPDERAIGRVELSTYLGAIVEHAVHLGDETRIVATGPSSGAAAIRRFAPGEAVALCWSAESERVFDAQERPVSSLRPPPGEPAKREIFSHA
jgi:putative spermidine/putrescine transport system ATP-binding protein